MTSTTIVLDSIEPYIEEIKSIKNYNDPENEKIIASLINDILFDLDTQINTYANSGKADNNNLTSLKKNFNTLSPLKISQQSDFNKFIDAAVNIQKMVNEIYNPRLPHDDSCQLFRCTIM
jgi:hypothetical protein